MEIDKDPKREDNGASSGWGTILGNFIGIGFLCAVCLGIVYLSVSVTWRTFSGPFLGLLRLLGAWDIAQFVGHSGLAICGGSRLLLFIVIPVVLMRRLFTPAERRNKDLALLSKNGMMEYVSASAMTIIVDILVIALLLVFPFLVNAVLDAPIFRNYTAPIVRYAPDYDIVKAGGKACERHPVEGSGEYRDKEGINPIIVLNASGDWHKWTDQFPGEWVPESLSDLELVACLGKEKRTAEAHSCHYLGAGDVPMSEYLIEVRIVEAHTGGLVSIISVFGESECPGAISSATSGIEGDKVRREDIQEKLGEWLK